MESLQTIKLELISQKAAIENKGGNVNVANTNPSPSEITAGIKSIPVPNLAAATATEEDVAAGKTFFSGNSTIKLGTKEVADLSSATATAEDVLVGKTFYSGNDEIKTGTRQNEGELYSKLFVTSDDIGSEKLYFNVPEGIKSLKSYLLYYCESKVIEFNFNSDIEQIGEYCFYKSINTTFPNFSTLTQIKALDQYAFAYLSQHPISLDNLPTSLESFGLKCFYDSVRPNSSIILHSNLNSIENYCFAVVDKTEMNQLSIADNISLTQLPGYMFENCIFDCDFKVPASVTSLAASFGYGCSFNNIIIPATCTTFGNAAFYCKKAEAASYRRLKTVTFESETPPTFGTYPFADQDKTNGFKIYVPDNAVDTYKAVSRLSGFVDYIYPVSQKS